MFQNNLLMAAASASGTALVEVGNSALYVDGNSESLSRTLSGAGTSRKTFTLGGWFYKTKPIQGSNGCRIFQWDNGTLNADRGMILIDNTVPDAIKLLIEDASDVATMIWTSTQVLRDQAWYHWCLTVDTTPALPVFMFFLNGIEITAWTKSTDTIAQDDVFAIADSGSRHAWGADSELNQGYFDGYMAECFYLDGQVMTDITDVVDISTDGLYVTPKSNTAMKALTFGDEGYYLDNATNAQTDASGNGNNFTNNNTVTTTTNTPTNQECLWNPLLGVTTLGAYYENISVFANGNRDIPVQDASDHKSARATAAVSSGTWYWEVGITDIGEQTFIGIGSTDDMDGNIGSSTGYYYGTNARKYNGDLDGGWASYGSTYTTGDVIGVALDLDTGDIEFFKNNSSEGVAFTGLTGSFVPAYFTYDAGGPAATGRFAEEDWSYTAPAGFLALSTTNIASATTRTASDTTKYFDTILYEGNGVGQRVGQFQPFDNSFTVGNSALFNGTNYLARTPSSTGSTTIATFSRWVKRTTPGNQDSLFAAYIDSGSLFQIYFPTDNTLHVYNYSSGYDWQLATNRVFEDSSQWFHVYIAIDTTESTSSDRVKIYINGVQETSLGTASYPSSSFANDFNTDSVPNYLGPYDGATGTGGLEGYTSETAWVDGTIYAPSYFGQTDTSTNRWIPKALAGITWGTNGFYQDYADSGNVGDDESGNGNDFSNNGTVVQSTDSPTTNYSILDPVYCYAAPTNGNLTLDGYNSNSGNVATLGLTSGKWYWETTMGSTIGDPTIGIVPADERSKSQYPGESANAFGWYTTNIWSGGGVLYSSYATTPVADQVNAVMLDLDSNPQTLTYRRANSQLATIPIPPNKTWHPTWRNGGSSDVSNLTINFGASDFTYTPPTGYSGVYQDNIESTDQFISAFSWIKNRDATDNHMLFDRVRGATKDIHSNDMVDEVTNVETVQRFLAGGVQVGDDVEVNTVNESYVLWNWMMENTGSGASNEDGSINTTSTLVDTTLGMSISKYVGTGANATVGHGLGVAPELIMIKSLDYGGSSQWTVYHSAAGGTKCLFLDTSGAATTAIGYFNNTDPTSSVFSVGTSTYNNGSSLNNIAYCFAPSQFISIGSYEGNNNADGTFIPTLNSLGVPIQPTFCLFKNMDYAGSNWMLYDTSRDPYNAVVKELKADTTGTENADSADTFDIVTGGLKQRGTATSMNKAYTYIYMAIGTPIIDTDGRILSGR